MATKTTKIAAYHVEYYGPGATCHFVGEIGREGPDGYVFVGRTRDGRCVVAPRKNRGAVPDVLLGCDIPCRVVVED